MGFNSCFLKVKMAGVAGMVAACFFCFTAKSQSDTSAAVVLDNPDYLLFTWKGDTLSTDEFAAFFEFMGKADSINAVMLEANIHFFLKRETKGVSEVNAQMLRSFFVGLDDYAAFCAPRQKRWKIIKE